MLVKLGLAVYGGQLLARRVSMKAVNYFGGVLFLVFAVLTLLQEVWVSETGKITKVENSTHIDAIVNAIGQNVTHGLNPFPNASSHA